MTTAAEPKYPVSTEMTLPIDNTKAAVATIANSTEKTVYVVNYEADGMTMTNHKWVIESEIQPAS